MTEHRSQIETIVRDALRAGNGGAGRAGIARMWGEVRRQLRALRDTTTSRSKMSGPPCRSCGRCRSRDLRQRHDLAALRQKLRSQENSRLPVWFDQPDASPRKSVAGVIRGGYTRTAPE